jgi:hypothetical protein
MSIGKLSSAFLLFAAASFAQCSSTSLVGAYGYTIDGTITNADNRLLTASQIGRITFNGTGGYTGVAISTTGGKAEVSEYSGVIEVLADCTAVGKTGTGAGATDFDLVVTDSGNSFVLVIRAGDATLSGNGAKIDNQGSCSNSSLNGVYGYQGDGTIAVDGKGRSFAEIGLLTFNGSGGMTGTYSFVGAGTAERKSFTGGVYALGDVCYAAGGYTIDGVTYEMNIFVVGSGNNFYYQEIAPGYVASGFGSRTVSR